MMHPKLARSKAKIILSGAFAIFVVSGIAIFIGFQSDRKPLFNGSAEMQQDSTSAEIPHRLHERFNVRPDLEMNQAIGVSDFGQRLDSADERLRTVEQSVSQLNAELSTYQSFASDISQSWSEELRRLKNHLGELAAADAALKRAVAHLKLAVQNMEAEKQTRSQSELPAAGLKLLSVSIWDDGAVAIVSLGNRKTALSIGNFFAGLKVEDLSVAEQSLTLYEPAANKLYTLYADAIVYKEERPQ